MAPYINNHNLKNLHKSLKIRQFRLNIILSRKYKSGCLKLFCFWLFQRCSGYFWLFQSFSYMFLVVSRVFWLFLYVSYMFQGFSYMFLYVSRVFWLFQGFSYMFPICFWLFLIVSRFLLYVHICLKGVPIYFNNVSIVSYMLKEYLKGVLVVSKLFQGCSYMFPICFFN